MSTAPLRVAVIGAGMIGDTHIHSARTAGAVIIGVLGSTPRRSAQHAQRVGAARGYATLEELLDDRPDVVHVCSPNATHAPYVREILAAGVHVVCEKPIGVTPAEAEELHALAEAAGVVATVPLVYRYHPVVREIRARHARGEFGSLILLHGTYLQDWMLDENASGWRVDPSVGGASRAFADIGSHWVDLIEYVSGERISEVSALTGRAYETRPAILSPSFSRSHPEGATRLPVTTEDTAIVSFVTASGVTGNVVVSQVSAGRKNRLWFELDGTAGSATFDQEHPEEAWYGSEDGMLLQRRGEGPTSPGQARLNLLPAGHSQGWLGAFEQYVADAYSAIRTGTVPDGLPGFADGVRSTHVIEAVLASQEERAWTPVDTAARISS